MPELTDQINHPVRMTYKCYYFVKGVYNHEYISVKVCLKYKSSWIFPHL